MIQMHKDGPEYLLGERFWACRLSKYKDNRTQQGIYKHILYHLFFVLTGNDYVKIKRKAKSCMVLPEVKKSSNCADADIKIHFWLNYKIPFS
jgi:hypothetical protein